MAGCGDSPILLEAHNPSPLTGLGNNTYLIAGVGHPDHVRAIAAALRDRRARLTTVVVTHGHPDHASGAPTLAAQHPAAILAKYPGPDDASAAVHWTWVDEGDRIAADDDSLVVLRTPGHSPDHIALWHEPSRSLFTGDLVVQGSSVMIAASRGGDLSEYLASLERLLALEPRVLFPRASTIPPPSSRPTSHAGVSANGRSSLRSPSAARPCRKSPNPFMMISARS